MNKRIFLEKLIGKRIKIEHSETGGEILPFTSNIAYSIVEKVFDDMVLIAFYVEDIRMGPTLYSFDYIRSITYSLVCD